MLKLLAVVWLLFPPLPAAAGQQGAPAPGPRTSQDRLKQWEQQLAALRARYEATKKLVEGGSASQENLDRLADQIEQVEQDRDRAKAMLVQQERAAAFGRPVDLSLRDAMVRRAATALAQISGLPIGVAPDVPESGRLSLEAHQAPVGVLLEVLARRSGLLIAPQANGALLKRWPFFEINGQRFVLAVHNPPWSNEWGMPPVGAAFPYGMGDTAPGRSSMMGGGFQVSPAGQWVPAVIPAPAVGPVRAPEPPTRRPSPAAAPARRRRR